VGVDGVDCPILAVAGRRGNSAAMLKLARVRRKGIAPILFYLRQFVLTSEYS
jgi:hypothetical protein